MAQETFTPEDEQWMRHALSLAQRAEALGEVPVGAVIVLNDQLVGEGFNQPITQHDPSAHAEIMALRQACQTLQNYRIPGATLYVTLEPCAMCAGALVHSRIARVIFATRETKAGALVSTQQFFQMPQLNHVVLISEGLLREEAGTQLSAFFKRRRAEKKAAKNEEASPSEQNSQPLRRDIM